MEVSKRPRTHADRRAAQMWAPRPLLWRPAAGACRRRLLHVEPLQTPLAEHRSVAQLYLDELVDHAESAQVAAWDGGAPEQLARVGMVLRYESGEAARSLWHRQFDEAASLARSNRGWSVAVGVALPARRDRKKGLGKGQLERVAAIVREQQLDVVYVDEELSASQSLKVQAAVGCMVVDRFNLILELFQQTASSSSREAQLQCDLAALTSERAQIVRTRGKGTFGSDNKEIVSGRGGGKGEGEKQMELERRELENRLEKIKRELKQVRKTRAVQRSGRGLPVVALVGYTNAGKSALLNALTDAAVLSEDRLFATLDTRMRALHLPGLGAGVGGGDGGGGGGEGEGGGSGEHDGRAILMDTVGFLERLPTGLVAAFRSTLEEIQHADAIL